MPRADQPAPSRRPPVPARTRRPRPVSLLPMLVLVLLSGCRTVITVGIDADDTGGGEVTVTAELDAEALVALGGMDRLALDDLEGTGWRVGEPDEAEQGGAVVSATQSFADSDELETVLGQIGGTDFVVGADSTVSDSFGRTTHDLSVELTATGDPAEFGDEALTAVLGGLPLGRTPEELAAEGVTEPGAGRLVLTVDIPGGGSDVGELDLTSGEPSSVEVAASSTVTQPLVLLLAAAAVVAGIAGVVLVVMGLVRRRSG